MPGYLYLRESPTYKIKNTLKFGHSENIYKCHITYAPNVFKLGTFTHMIQILSDHDIGDIESRIMCYWDVIYNLALKENDTYEFFYTNCVNYLDEALQTIPNLNYRYLSKNELNAINQYYISIFPGNIDANANSKSNIDADADANIESTEIIDVVKL